MAGWFLVTVLVAIAFDSWAPGWMRTVIPEDSIGERVFKIPNHIFRRWGVIVVGVALLIHPQRRRVFVCYVAVFVSCGIIVQALKILIGRARPQLGEGWLSFSPFSYPWSPSYDSFPSGHTSGAVAFTVLVGLYFGRRWAWALAPLALLAISSRVIVLRHFPSDLLGGAGVALLTIHGCIRLLGRSSFPRYREAFSASVEAGSTSLRHGSSQSPLATPKHGAESDKGNAHDDRLISPGDKPGAAI